MSNFLSLTTKLTNQNAYLVVVGPISWWKLVFILTFVRLNHNKLIDVSLIELQKIQLLPATF